MRFSLKGFLHSLVTAPSAIITSSISRRRCDMRMQTCKLLTYLSPCDLAFQPRQRQRNRAQRRRQAEGRYRLSVLAHRSGQDAFMVSQRVLATEEPVIVATKKLMAGAKDVISLAQGVVHWGPPHSALDAAADALRHPSVSSYGPADGLPELVAALEKKVELENGLPEHRVMITSGANQAFVNVVLALVDASDRVVLFSPYYFNHLMALQMTGGADSVVFGPCHSHTLHPDLDWLEQEMKGPSPPKMVVLISPCNPTGILLGRAELERAAEICARANAWLVMDNTYEYLVYGDRQHVCISGDHIIHLFSFSKAFGMMGYRVGYCAYRDTQTGSRDGYKDKDIRRLSEQLQKVQDTIAICPMQLSCHVALHATREGRPWVEARLQSLVGNREILIDSMSPVGSIGDGVFGGEGAIYLWARLPAGCQDDNAVVEYLVKQHGVCLIPGSSCGAPGYVRVAFGNLQPELCQQAAARLKQGLQQLVSSGLPA